MDKFYSEGLYFSCTGCGECCRLPGGAVEINLAEALKMAQYLNLSFQDFIDQYCALDENSLHLIDNPQKECIFLENDRCLVYEVRPLQCRTFPFWPENLKSEYRWKQLPDFCPGVGQGKLYGFEEIEKIRLDQKRYDKARRKELRELTVKGIEKEKLSQCMSGEENEND